MISLGFALLGFWLCWFKEPSLEPYNLSWLHPGHFSCIKTIPKNCASIAPLINEKDPSDSWKMLDELHYSSLWKTHSCLPSTNSIVDSKLATCIYQSSNKYAHIEDDASLSHSTIKMIRGGRKAHSSHLRNSWSTIHDQKLISPCISRPWHIT